MARDLVDRSMEPNALRRYELLSENTRDIVLFLRPDGQILEANRAAVAAYGYSRAELVEMNIRDLRSPETLEDVDAQIANARKAGLTFETTHRRKDGSTFPVEVSSTPSEIGGMLLSMVRDITRRRRSEATQKLLRDVDMLILRRQPTGVILQSICDRLAALFGYTLVWIGMKQREGAVSILAHAGVGDSFLDGIVVRWDESPEGMGPTGRAIRTGQAQTINVGQADLPAWRDRVKAHGLRDTLSLPLVANEETLGALSLYSVQDGVFDSDTVDQLTTFAHQVAISLLAARDQEQIHLQTAALEAAANGVVITDRDGQILWVNPAWCRLTGYTKEEALGGTPRLLKSGSHNDQFYRQMWESILAGQTWRGEMYNRRKDGSIYAEDMTITPVRSGGGQITHFIAIKQDVSERKEQEEQLRHLALHDPVTDLPNRRALRDALERAVERSRRGHTCALLLMDMDNFKAVNDSEGHAAGDNLLVGASRLLRSVLRPFDLLSRWGGDEFAVLLEDVSLEDAVLIGERLRKVVYEGQHLLSGRDLHLGISIGIAPIDGTLDPDVVMSIADRALYTAKEEGKNRVVICDSQLGELGESNRWATRIKAALSEGRLSLSFQPIVRLSTGAVEHYEALVRLRDEQGSLIYPQAFIPAAERFGLMPAIDRWVMEQVLLELQKHPDQHIFVNLSGRSLSDQALLAYLEHRILSSGDLAGRLGFEITETAAVRDLATAQQWMTRLKSLGCRFALDDFGVGFASFGYLKALPVDFVKIAGSFTRNLESDPINRSLVQAIRTVAHALGKESVAEWVETESVASLLRELEVEYGQGAHWGMPGERLEE